MDTEYKINEEKKRCLEFALNNSDRDIYIYGAGKIAKPLYVFLTENSIKVKAFCVTNSEDNKKSEFGVPIISFKDISEPQNAAYFLGINVRHNADVVKELKKSGCKNYHLASEYLRYFGEYEHSFFVNPMMEITTRIGCKVNCRYCPQDVLIKNYYITGKESRELKWDDFKKCLDKMPKDVLIEFAGFSEPFLNFQCIDMVEYAFEQGYKVNMFTTLMGLNDKLFERMLKIRFEEFVLHVPDEEGFSFIPTSDEYYKWLMILSDAKKPNSDEPYVTYACSQGTVPENIKKLMGNKVRFFVSLTDRAGNLDDEGLFGRRNIRGKIRCELSNKLNHNVLLPDGTVVLCAQDYSLKHRLGNLIEQSYESVIDGNENRFIEKCMYSDEGSQILCRNCSLAHEID